MKDLKTNKWMEEIEDNKKLLRDSNIVAKRATIYLKTITESWEIVKYQCFSLLLWTFIYVVSCLILAFSFSEQIDLRVGAFAVGINASISVLITVLSYFLHSSFIANMPPAYIEMINVSVHYEILGALHLKLMRRLKSLMEYVLRLSIITLFILLAIDVIDYFQYKEIINEILFLFIILFGSAGTTYFVVKVIRILRVYSELLKYRKKQRNLIMNSESEHP